jgi:hypothetical protein
MVMILHHEQQQRQIDNKVLRDSRENNQRSNYIGYSKVMYAYLLSVRFFFLLLSVAFIFPT